MKTHRLVVAVALVLALVNAATAHAQWEWLATLAPLVDGIRTNVAAIKNKNRDQKALQQKIQDDIQRVYTAALEGVSTDATQLAMWKPVVATVQGCREQANRWQYTREIAAYQSLPDLVWNEITAERAKALKVALIGVRDDLAARKEGKLTWQQGGADLLASLNRMIAAAERIEKAVNYHSLIKVSEGQTPKLLEQLKRQSDIGPSLMSVKNAADLNNLANETLGIGLTGIQDESLTVLAYWDGFMASLFTGMDKATKDMQAALKKTVEGLPIKYAETKTYGELLKSVADALQK